MLDKKIFMIYRDKDNNQSNAPGSTGHGLGATDKTSSEEGSNDAVKHFKNQTEYSLREIMIMSSR